MENVNKHIKENAFAWNNNSNAMLKWNFLVAFLHKLQKLSKQITNLASPYQPKFSYACFAL